jgi:hypothetical protein
LRQLLKCNDLQLVHKVHEMEKYGPEDDPVLGRFRALRTDLSRMSWNSFVAALGDCDAGPLARTGVMTFPLDEGFAARLASVLLGSPKTEMRRDDFAMGWVGTAGAQCEYLNACNEYRAFTPEGMALIAEFLQEIGSGLEKTLGHRFRIGSMRQFQLVPERVASGRHLDGWPVAIRKLFILPQGCGRSTGTTWFRQRDGKQLELESDKPIWVVFENSVVWHAAVSAKGAAPDRRVRPPAGARDQPRAVLRRTRRLVSVVPDRGEPGGRHPAFPGAVLSRAARQGPEEPAAAAGRQGLGWHRATPVAPHWSADLPVRS